MNSSVTEGERIQFLDVLRGLALFGILLVNLPILGLPLAEMMTTEPVGTDALVATLVRALAENKFMSLFSLLFGMGLALQVDRAERQGRDPNSFYPKRLGLLAAFGLANGVFLFFGDILLPYAVAGTVLYLLRKQSNRTLFTIAGILLTIGISLSVVFEGIIVPDPDAESVEFVKGLDTALREGSFLSGSLARSVAYLFWLLESCFIAFNWRILALFLVGCAALRLGWAKPDAIKLHRRLAFVALPIGLALEALSIPIHGHERTALRVVDVLLHQIGGLLLSAGYAGAVALWCASGLAAAPRRWFANTGRMALTNYLSQAFIAGWIFYGHGAGLLGRFSRLEILGLTVLIFAVQVALSTWWLRGHKSGPLEALWRRITHGRAQAA